MNREQYFWDIILPELKNLFIKPWGKKLGDINRRQRFATIFAMRALRRIMAVDALFKAGYYWESHALIRNGYEDWLQIAYLMRESGEARCNNFAKDIHKHDARVYDAFKALCGPDSADFFFREIPPKVLPFVGFPRTKTKPKSFVSLATDVGLRKLHDFVYTYLSGRSHPTGRIEELFDKWGSIGIARTLRRDPSEETRLALWLSWFTARILVLASKEFDIDRESFCSKYLLPIIGASGSNLETCVFVKEYGVQ
jgi:hypothetical protein